MSLDLTPAMGVQVSIDGQAARNVATGDRIALDGKEHSLHFTCAVCVPVDREVAAGDKDDTVVAKLSIKPATLDIVGDGNDQYAITGHPEITGRVGANSVPMDRSRQTVTVTDLNTHLAVTVELYAGHGVQAVFAPAASASP